MPVAILTYHKIGRHKELGITTVTRRRFVAHMDLLKGLGLDFVTAGEAAVKARAQAAVAVTFDDGYETVYDEALPEMLARNITGTVFQVVGAVGGWNRWDVNLSLRPVRHLSWKQLRKLAEAGFEIGSHTLTHRDLTRLDDATLRRELHDSRKAIENEVGERVSSVSYPFGRYSRRVIDEARAAGYTCGFTSCPVSTSDPMVLGRWAVHSIDGTGALMRKLGLKAGTGLERFKSKAIAKLSLGTTLVRR